MPGSVSAQPHHRNSTILGGRGLVGGPFAALCDKDAVLLISAVDEGGDVRLARPSSDPLHSSILLPKSFGARVVVLARHSPCCLALLWLVVRQKLSLTIVSEMHCLQLVEVKHGPVGATRGTGCRTAPLLLIV